jgi:plastocyanin
MSARRAVLGVVAIVGVLAGCGSDESADGGETADASRTIEVTATEYAFNGDPGAIVAGDTVEFSLVNAGQLDHSLEVLSDGGRSLGRTERIGPGGSDAITVTFDDAGTYRLICDVDDHLSRGQSATIVVAEG